MEFLNRQDCLNRQEGLKRLECLERMNELFVVVGWVGVLEF